MNRSIAVFPYVPPRPNGCDRRPHLHRDGRLLVVVPSPTGEEGAHPGSSLSEVRILADPDRAVARRLGLRGAAVVIADEWGEIYFAADADSGHELPAPEEIVEWVRFISIQCPECEQPEGEWRTI